MFTKQNYKKAAIFAGSALALSISSVSHGFSFKAGDTDVNIGGYAKLDMIYDVDTDLGQTVTHGNIPLDGDTYSKGHTRMHAFESRFGISTATPVGGDTLKTRIEGDFSFGSNRFRLRHAYGEWKGVLAGQTWTNFTALMGATAPIDFTGIPGPAQGARQTQLRYTVDKFSVALEEPGTAAVSGRVADPDVKFPLPELTARYTERGGDFNYSASGMVRQLEYDRAQNGDPSDQASDTAVGYALGLEAAFKVTPDITLRGAVTYGDGAGSYITLVPSADGYGPYVAPAFVGNDGKLETVKALGASVGTTIAVGPGALTVGYGLAEQDLDDLFADGVVTGGQNERYTSLDVNYIWSPVKSLQYGIEVGRHTRKTVDGRDGDAVRIQGMAKYHF